MTISLEMNKLTFDEKLLSSFQNSETLFSQGFSSKNSVKIPFSANIFSVHIKSTKSILHEILS